MAIISHAHQPSFPELRAIPFFNAGSYGHPRNITGLEIVNESIA